MLPSLEPRNADLLRLWMKHQPSVFSGYLRVACTLGHLCDGNFCAAILLGNFYEDGRQVRAEYAQEEDDEWSGYLMLYLFELTSYLFTRDDLVKALSLLEAKV